MRSVAGGIWLALASCDRGGSAPELGEPLVAASSGSPLLFRGAPPRNLVMVSIDTLRRDQLARFGGASMPFLDGVASQGVILADHAGCSNWTYHATTCTLRGSDPLEWGFAPRLDLQIEGIQEDLPPGLDFLSSWLGSAGFHTILVSTNAVLSEGRNNGVGYDEFLLAPSLGNTPAAVAGEQAVAMLDAALAGGGVDRWLLHLHLMEPHRPYAPPEAYREGWDALPPIPYDLDTHAGHDQAVLDALTSGTPEEVALLERHMRTRYDGDVRWLDDQLSGLWDQLEARGWLDDSLVVFWSDHGEQHFERGYQAHAFTLYSEENAVIALFWAKNLLPGVWSGPTHQTDLAPTVLDVFDLPVPDVVTGVPLGHADPERARFAFTAGKVGVFQSVRQGPDELVFGWSDPAAVEPIARFAQGIHQYDLVADPEERIDRYDPSSPRTQELWSLLRPRVEAATALLPDRTVAWPEGL